MTVRGGGDHAALWDSQAARAPCAEPEAATTSSAQGALLRLKYSGQGFSSRCGMRESSR
jgi:hypothetical protein